MKPEEAADLLASVAASLRANPSQFNIHFNVNAAGAVGIGGPGGHGIVGIANGPGIGFYASAPTTVQLQQVEQQANAQLNVQYQSILAALESIAQDLRAHSLQSSKRDSFLAQLKTSWLPNVVVSLVAAILDRVTRP